jgi:hypothetical protein
MTLSKNQISDLNDAIHGYSFPCVYYDFLKDYSVIESDMQSVEKFIRNDLTSGDPDLVKNGLSNVLYWGLIFREQVTQGQLYDAALLFADIRGDGLMEIKRIGLPQFSGMSFVSKVRMFLDPAYYPVLDQQILKMNDISVQTVLKNIAFGEKETQLRISGNNVRVYADWCKKCLAISGLYFDDKYRAVDIERGFFELIQTGRIELAAEILSKA